MTTAQTPEFTLKVDGVKGLCPAGEAYAARQLEAGAIPVLSCEGPCIRGEIARLAANYVAQASPALARACHAETFFVPHSAMAQWVKGAKKTVMIDGCFLKCHGRVLGNLVSPERVIHIDAFAIHRKYSDVFSMDDVPEDERKSVAHEVAGRILEQLRHRGDLSTPA